MPRLRPARLASTVLLTVLAIMAYISPATAAAITPAVTKLLPTSGPLSGGTIVTVTGSSFTSGATVLFGGVKSPAVTYVSPTTLKASAPARLSAGTIQVVVKTAAGTSPITAATAYTYVAPAGAPTISSTVPSTLPTTGGLLTVAGANLSTVTKVTLDGTATPFTKETSTSLRLTIPAGVPGSVTAVAVTSPTGTATLLLPRSLEPSPALRAPVLGLSDRVNIPTDPLVTGATIDIPWNLAETSADPTVPLDLTTVKTEIDTAATLGVSIRLRILAGLYTPSWVLSRAGTLRWAETHTGKLLYYTIPRWWTPAYNAAYTAFQTRLAAELGAYPNVQEVAVTQCMTIYGEPFMRQSGLRNGTTIKATDYTYTSDLSCLYSSITSTAAIWPNQRVSLAVNPFQGFRPPSTDRKLLDTFAIMRFCRGTLGDRCVLGNNSLRGTTTATMTCPGGAVVPASGQEGGYNETYCELRRLGAPLYFQTARPSAIGSWQATLDRAVTYGASNVELNTDYPLYDPSALATYVRELFG